MNRFTMTNLALFMSFKVSPKEVEKVVDKLEIEPSGNLALASEESVNLAVVQMLRRRYASLTEYITDMNSYVADAANRRAQLVCFPAYAGSAPISFMPQFDSTLGKIQPQSETGLPNTEALHDCLSYFSDFMFDAYYHTMSQLAARHQIYIMAGSVLYFEDSELRHRSFLFNDEGDMVGYQDKISLNSLEQELQLDPCSEIKVFDTPFGSLAILIGEDVHYFETARIAKNLGAQILINPTVFTKEYTPIDAALGLNLRVQECGIYGVQSVMVGDTDLGFTLEGPSSVFAPTNLIKNQNGILAQSSGRFESDIVSTRINLERLDTLQDPYLQDKNLELMKNYVDKIY